MQQLPNISQPTKSLGKVFNKLVTSNIKRVDNKVKTKLQKKNPISTKTSLNKVIKALSQRSKYLNHELCTSYEPSLLSPETVVDGKVPRQLSQTTIGLYRHITIPLTANVLGNISVVFSPYYLVDNLNTTTTLYVNNDPLYNTIAAFGVGHTAVAVNYTLPAGNVDDYRLVCASAHLVPQIALMNSTGKIAGAVISQSLGPAAVGSTTNQFNNLATIANIESHKPYAEADVCVPESLRLVWTPHDINDFGMYNLNQDQLQTALERENVLVFDVVGAPTSAKFNLELFLMFEVTPVAGSVLTGMGRFCQEQTDPMDVLFTVRNNPQLLAHPYVTTNHMHDNYDGRTFSVQTGEQNINLQRNSQIPKTLNSKGNQLYQIM